MNGGGLSSDSRVKVDRSGGRNQWNYPAGKYNGEFDGSFPAYNVLYVWNFGNDIPENRPAYDKQNVRCGWK